MLIVLPLSRVSLTARSGRQIRNLLGVPRFRLPSLKEYILQIVTPIANAEAMMMSTTNERPVAGRGPADRCGGGGSVGGVLGGLGFTRQE